MKRIMVMLMLMSFVSSTEAGIFRDDFNDADLEGWTFVRDAEDGGIQNGELVLGSRKSTVIIAVDGVIARDYEIIVSVKIRKLVPGRIANGPLIDDFEVQWDDLAVQPQRKLTTTWGQIKRSFR